MEKFTVSPLGFKEVQKAIIIRMLSVIAFVIFILIILPAIMSNSSDILNSNTAFLLIILFSVFTFSFFTSIKKQKALLTSYKLLISEDSITRKMLNTPTILILKKDVQEIIKGANGSFTIVGDSKLNAIGVSAQIERKEELEQILASIKSITIKKSSPWLQKLQMPIAFFCAGLLFATYYVSNKYVASLCGIAFSIFMIYSIIIIQKSKNIDLKTKRLSYFILIPLLSVILSIVMKWSE